jgi:peptidoglycan hydrolase-like protein with peptidoglycan-binding domain
MRPQESFLSQPIRSLQTMLRVLAEYDNRYETLVPDGIYGPATLRAVSKFQRLHGLPVTGVTDQDTWERIVAEYEPALIHMDEAEALNIILEPEQVIRLGERHPHMHLVQAMLAVLEDAYKSIGPVQHTGILDHPTASALSAFQSLNALPMTGHLDKRTWKALALQYPQAARLADNGANVSIL